MSEFLSAQSRNTKPLKGEPPFVAVATDGVTLRRTLCAIQFVGTKTTGHKRLFVL